MASSSGRVSPADFPPPVEVEKEFVKRSLDGEDAPASARSSTSGGRTS